MGDDARLYEVTLTDDRERKKAALDAALRHNETKPVPEDAEGVVRDARVFLDYFGHGPEVS